MNREDIISFLDDIYLDFYKKMYSYSSPEENTINTLLFPVCCAQASNLISSFLSYVTKYNFRTVSATNFTNHTHFWCICDDLDVIIDMTYFQFDSDCGTIKNQLIDRELSPDELEDLLFDKTKFHYTIEEYKKEFYPFFIDLIEQYSPSNLSIAPDENYFLSYRSFFSFFDKYIERIIYKEDLCSR